jgi:Domain of unknown function (DUF5655)
VGPEEFFAGHVTALAVYVRVRSILEELGPVDVRTTRSQVAFRRARGFAYLWLPGQYLAKPAADVVLSFALGRHDPSRRLKEVVHPSPGLWMHHVEINGVDDIDDEVAGWLREAAERAG